MALKTFKPITPGLRQVVLIDRSDSHGAKQAFEAAVRIDGASPGGRDALKRLRTE